MKKIYNFSAGPAMLPEAVLERAREEMFDYEGTGMSVMEISHRSREFMDIVNSAESALRELMQCLKWLRGGDFFLLFAKQNTKTPPCALQKTSVTAKTVGVYRF